MDLNDKANEGSPMADDLVQRLRHTAQRIRDWGERSGTDHMDHAAFMDEAAAEIERLRAARQWRPIAEAPKDTKQTVDLWVRDHEGYEWRHTGCRWVPHKHLWFSYDGDGWEPLDQLGATPLYFMLAPPDPINAEPPK